jgi:transposase
LATLAIWKLCTYAFVWMSVTPGLGFWRAMVMTQSTTAVANTVPGAGPVIGIGMTYGMLGSWGGWAGLAARRRGRRPGEQAALSESQQQEVIALVRETTPDQLGLAGFLWTRDAVSELISQRYGLLLARTTVGGYLRGWGFSPQRPQHRALEQNPAAVRRWLAET